VGQTTTAIAFGAAALLAAAEGCTSTSAGVGATDGADMIPDGQSAAIDASACVAAGGFCASGDVSGCRIGPQDCGFPGGFCCDPIIPYEGCHDGGIKASSYDQSCTSDSDCVAVAEGDSCLACAFSCPNAVINPGALAKYRSDIASAPHAAFALACFGCPIVTGPCCLGGSCHIGEECIDPVAADAAAVDASAE
jgi:hypothetical protein